MCENDSELVHEHFLLKTVLIAEQEGIGGRCLTDKQVGLNYKNLLRDVDRRINDLRTGRDVELTTPFHLSAAGVSSTDLTFLARMEQIRPSIGQDNLIELMLRGLHRRDNNHVVITGEPGVGKTELLQELARRAAAGEIPFLARKKIVLVNCDGVAPEDSRTQMRAILSAAKGRRDVIICLDHCEALLRHAGQRESDNRGVLRAALRDGNAQLVIVLDTRYYGELFAHDHALGEMFTKVSVPELDADETIAVLEGTAAGELEKLYGVTIEPRAMARAAHASREFIMSERLPSKAISAIRDACERISYERTMNRERDPVVQDADVIQAIAEKTGIDESTVGGSGSDVDFRVELTKSVVGQERVVDVVADRLMRIKAGAVREGKPAAVFLFAGLTGTGKTEIAKAIARIYSASRKLSIYPMANFVEDHAISGIVGVPPGYVGFESGGRLVNDLNADPYGVILFDEAEKAHPNIWQSMLPLFDEAWVEDRRNVKAYGNHAIFILTSNAGQDFIRQNYDRMEPDELKERVAELLVDYQTPSTGQRPFSPEFLGRFSDIVIFSPLSSEAMRQITELQVAALVAQWGSKREKDIVVDKQVVDHIARISHEENERFRGTKGGRIVARYVSELIELELLRLLQSDPESFRDASRLRASLADGDVVVDIESIGSSTPAEATAAASDGLRGIFPPDVAREVTSYHRQLARIIEHWQRRLGQHITQDAIDQVARELANAEAQLASQAEQVDQLCTSRRDALEAVLQDVAGRGEQDDA